MNARTDIPGNFGVIFSIPRSTATLFDMGPGRVYEERTLNTITPDAFSSVAVPLDKVDEVRERVAKLGLTIPVLPTEAVDYHLSRFPVPQLTSDLKVDRLQYKHFEPIVM